jgi:membrane protein implicated in regulation of membrane protease activity
MDWTYSTLWWVAAGVLVAAELAAGTFYLLMLAFGCVAGALAAHAGLSGSGQISMAAVVGAGATALWHYRRARRPRSAPVDANPDAMLDIGQRLQVAQWQPDRSARVDYRGSAWTVQWQGAGEPAPGEHVIVAVRGNRLVVEPAPR